MYRTKEEFVQQAKVIESQTYYADGRWIDGAIYTNFAFAWDFVRDYKIFLGQGDFEKGWQIMIKKVEDRRMSGEKKADPTCGNWILWTILNELGVSRDRV